MEEFFKKHKTGILGTLAFHAILALFLFFFKFSTPLPLPSEKGILINFGNTEQASGENALRQNLQSTQKQSQPQPQQQQTEQQQTQEEIITQDNEEAPAVKTEQKKEKTEQQKEKEPVETKNKDTSEKEETKEQEEKEEQQREVNRKALYPGKSNDQDGENEGVEKGEGNQGKETGSPFSDNYSDKNSKGMGGIDFSLSGRNPESLPKPEYNYQEEGKVVVEITVDKYGNVTNATAGVKGSTTLNDNLLKAARKAALNAKFDRKPSAPAYQKGTITYYFILQ
jgi:TonB family protein